MFYKSKEGMGFTAGGASQQPLPNADVFPKIESGSANGLKVPETVSAKPIRSTRDRRKKQRRQRAQH